MTEQLIAASLPPYSFEQLNALYGDTKPNVQFEPISLAEGEPTITPSPEILEVLQQKPDTGLNRYPTQGGNKQLREAIASALERRCHLPANAIDANRSVLPVSGTREAVFSLIQTLLLGKSPQSRIVFANPFYPIYQGASLMTQHQSMPVLESELAQGLPSFTPEELRQIGLVVLCSPHNPTGNTLDADSYQRLLQLADDYDFYVVNDECYLDIYQDDQQPPLSLLEYCWQSGRTDFDRCLVLHSLSKRSGLAGLRSGAVIGDGKLLDVYAKYRTYHGVTMAEPVQRASIHAWNDDDWVEHNRQHYRTNIEQFISTLHSELQPLAPTPPGSFYIWFKLPGNSNNLDDKDFALLLWQDFSLRVLPGSLMGLTDASGSNPGTGFIRCAMVPTAQQSQEAAQRINLWYERYH